MRHTAYITAILFCMCIFNSCENFRDDNGDLGGMWQLTMWQTQSSSGYIDSVVATNDAGIYYSFHQRIVQYMCSSKNLNEYGDRVFSLFRHTPDSLFLYNFTYSAPYDSIPSDDVLRSYGINENGAYRINTLTSSRMVISDPTNILTFRKY